ncbi:hypothetical protein FGO68_gene1243 [Halteria grandinella]|uniref:RING-type domain-containing protein n=1 Tax=Halteria grandinella TaxID=5974 RepID=A0A8J8SV86_HALGN|nr:hypothetical protein FGO68_gene1243 [Halteria grandinella]
MKDIQAYYLAKELGSEGDIRFMRTKHYPLCKIDKIQADKDTTCPICCEEMVNQAVQLPCDKRHLYHKECIQLWLTKNRLCPLCKVQVI